MGDYGGTYATAVASLGIAVIQAAVASDVARKQNNIANKQLGLAEFVQNTWKSNHLPVELKLLAEMSAIPLYVPKYDLATVRATNDVAIAFGRTKADTRRNMSPYCIGSFQALERQFSIGQALAEVDAVATARRREDGRKDIKDQQRVENIVRAGALGRGLLDTSGAAMRAAAVAYESGGSTIASALNSGGALLGYLVNRDENAGKRRTGGSNDWDRGSGSNMKFASDRVSANPTAYETSPTSGSVGYDVDGGPKGGVGRVSGVPDQGVRDGQGAGWADEPNSDGAY